MGKMPVVKCIITSNIKLMNTNEYEIYVPLILIEWQNMENM
jgi:hypothetical protein